MVGRIHVCPLSQVEATLRSSRARHVVSLLADTFAVPVRPDEVSAHLRLAVSDVVSRTPGHVLAGVEDVKTMLNFLHDWDRRDPLLIHCYAGVSRSTAAAFIALCALDPRRSEAQHALTLRSASSTATPNPHLVALADWVLARDGRMTSAIAAIGRGAECFEGNCFSLSVPNDRFSVHG